MFFILKYLFYILGVSLIALVAIIRARKDTSTIGFFHPYWEVLFSNSGGGGERVLWTMIKHLKESEEKIVVYTVDEVEGEVILRKVQSYFGIEIEKEIEFVYLKLGELINPANFPFLTLFFQFIGSYLLVSEGLFRKSCALLIDTHGHPGGYPFIKLCGIELVSYVHYPVIQQDMIENASKKKKVYYRILLKAYGWMGFCCTKKMCNSNWTNERIQPVWGGISEVVYPPCDISSFLKLDFEKPELTFNVISVSQFRPEKNHELQIQSFAEYLKKSNSKLKSKLILVGSVRGPEDKSRVEELRKLADEIGVAEFVEFQINVSLEVLLELMETAKVGIHTMWNEHFGIGIIEMMASSLIVIAHNSGGPRDDIITPSKNGFLCSSVFEYANTLLYCEENYESLQSLRKSARKSSLKYSEDAFAEGFLNVING